ncbi:MAG: hypothetical protein IKM70_01205, partial [Firmicutes bacterium]|nr:hypothetical protein [Bacillota bacterium]
MKKLLSVLLALTLIFAFASTAMAATVEVNSSSGTASAGVVDLTGSPIYVYSGDTVVVKFGNDTSAIIDDSALPTGVVVSGNKLEFGTAVTAGTNEYTATLGGEGG